MIRGVYQVRPPLPFVPGQEIAGVVVGPNGSPWAGRRVAAKVLWGGFAEFAAARESMLIGLPEDLSFEAGATLPVVWPTAWIALHDRARLGPGESLLVHAGASGVGLAAIALGKQAGARIAATVGSAAKLVLAREAGADAVFNYRDEGWLEAVRAFAPDGFDVVLDPVGGDVTDASIKLLGWGGDRRLLVARTGRRAHRARRRRGLAAPRRAPDPHRRTTRASVCGAAARAGRVRREAGGGEERDPGPMIHGERA
jgi:NADPH2:quinone reductase